MSLLIEIAWILCFLGFVQKLAADVASQTASLRRTVGGQNPALLIIRNIP